MFLSLIFYLIGVRSSWRSSTLAVATTDSFKDGKDMEDSKNKDRDDSENKDREDYQKKDKEDSEHKDREDTQK